MTRDHAFAMAETAFDEMGSHPDIWATHGFPSEHKAYLITKIIADTILKAIAAEEEAEAWRGITAKLRTI